MVKFDRACVGSSKSRRSARRTLQKFCRRGRVLAAGAPGGARAARRRRPDERLLDRAPRRGIPRGRIRCRARPLRRRRAPDDMPLTADRSSSRRRRAPPDRSVDGCPPARHLVAPRRRRSRPAAARWRTSTAALAKARRPRRKQCGSADRTGKPRSPAVGSSLPACRRCKVLSSREQNPNDASPLTYREYAFAVRPEPPKRSPPSVSARAARATSKRISRREDGQAREPRGVRRRVHRQAARPPLATLTWKDWKGEPVVGIPATDARRAAVRVRRQQLPPPFEAAPPQRTRRAPAPRAARPSAAASRRAAEAPRRPPPPAHRPLRAQTPERRRSPPSVQAPGRLRPGSAASTGRCTRPPPLPPPAVATGARFHRRHPTAVTAPPQPAPAISVPVRHRACFAAPPPAGPRRGRLHRLRRNIARRRPVASSAAARPATS